MRRPPRLPDEPLFSGRTAVVSLLQGAGVLALSVATFGIAIERGVGENVARALAFTTLVVANLALILVNRSWSRTVLATLKTPNAALWWVLGGAAIVLALVLYVPFLRELFAFGTLHPIDIVICLGAAFASLLWFEGWKVLSHWRKPARSTGYVGE